MFYRNGIWGKVLKAIFGVVALLSVTGGLISCDVGGEEDGEETEEQEGEEDDN